MGEKLYWYSFNNYLKKKYPFKVRKISVDAGFTCPNRDGSKSSGGCIYCENRSFSPNSSSPLKSVKEQIGQGMDFYRRNFKAKKFIIYFQAYTNTYAPLEHLKKLYEEAVSYPDVVALAIGTRPDCVPDEVLDLVESYTKKVDVWLELGLQTIHNSTLNFINRAHSFAEFEDAIKRAKGRDIGICVHAIFGLPGETWDMMIETAEQIAEMGLDAIKIHHLYVAKDTAMAKMYKKGQIKVLTLDEWAKLVADVLERLPPTMIIQRLMGEVNNEYLIAPKWNASKNEVLTLIQKKLASRNSFQGKLYLEKKGKPGQRLEKTAATL